MDQLKPWQKILIVVALVVLVGGIWFSFRGKGPDFGDHIYLVDVTSGELYTVDLTGIHGLMLPAKNPDTGLRTLLPLELNEDGKGGRISPRYQNTAERLLEKNGGHLSAQIDPESWRVKTDIKAAKRLDLKSKG